MSGRFITLEGIDGAGKSSHVDALCEWLRAHGDSVVMTREPGGSPLAEQLRELLLHRPMDALTESLLVFAARRDHLRECIEPALARGATVVCDRFTDATFAYQGAGRGFDLSVLSTLETWVQQGLQPSLTFWFDLPAETAAERRAAARSPDRFEQLDVAFFKRVRQGYEARRAQSPQRFARLDAAQSREQVWAQLVAQMEQRGW
jgi:dTMP kinase